MLLFRHVLCVGCLSILFGTYALAQLPLAKDEVQSKEKIRGELLSGDPYLVAWGAHDALISGDRDLIPDLLSLARQWQPTSIGDPRDWSPLSPEQLDQRDAMAAIVDALIQMNVHFPSETLQTLAPDFGDYVAVLLSRMPVEESGPLAFELYRASAERSYGLEYVSAALLALHPQPGFAADILSNTSVRADVDVVLPDSNVGRGGSSGCGGAIFGFSRKDWPLFGQFIFSRENRDGEILLVKGLVSIYAERILSGSYDGRAINGLYLGPNDRRELIAEMLNVSEKEIPWGTRVAKTIEFQSQRQLNGELLAFVEEQQQMYRETARILVDRDLLRPSELLQSLPQLKLYVNDMRGEDYRPLSSELPNLPARVELSMSN